MAFTQGELITYNDINNVKTAVDNAYKTTKGSAPTWNNAPDSAGDLLEYAFLSEINSIGQAANESLVTTGKSSHNSPTGSYDPNCYVLFNSSRRGSINGGKLGGV